MSARAKMDLGMGSDEAWAEKGVNCAKIFSQKVYFTKQKHKQNLPLAAERRSVNLSACVKMDSDEAWAEKGVKFEVERMMIKNKDPWW